MAANEELYLLFQGSFVHDPTENELRVDMVKFSQPVCLKEARVIPKCCRMHPKLTEPDKIGLTTPDSMTLDFFVSNTDNILATTFERVESLHYAVDHFAVQFEGKLWSDVLLVRGNYKALTLCLYGQSKNPPSQASLQDPGHEESGEGGLAKTWANDGDDEKATEVLVGDELFEPFSPDHSPSMFDIFDDDLAPPLPKRANTSGYEEFSDDEITFGDDDFDQEGDLEMYGDDMDLWFTSSVNFNPYQCQLSPLKDLSYWSETQIPPTPPGGARAQWTDACHLRDAVLKTSEASSMKALEILEAAESVLFSSLTQLELSCSTDVTAVVKKLVSWVCNILSLELPSHAPPAVNVRLIKAACKAVAVISKLGGSSVATLLECGVMDQLLDILCGHSVTSLKLLAIEALRALVEQPVGLRQFLGSDIGKSSTSTAYQRLIKFDIGQPARVVAALKVLFRAVHACEVVAALEQTVNELLDGTKHVQREGAGNPADPVVGVPTVKDGSEEMAEEEESQGVQWRVQLPDSATSLSDIINSIVLYLEELTKFLRESDTVTGGFPTTVPTFASLEQFAQGNRKTFASISKWLQARCFLECLLVILTHPAIGSQPDVFAVVADILMELMTFPAGLGYLASSVDVISAMTEHLCRQAVEEDVPYNAAPSLADLLKEGSKGCAPHHLGILLVYHIQVMKALDDLKQQPIQNVEDLDEAKCLASLHTVYSMTLTPAGRHSVASVLSMMNNLTILLPFVEPKGDRTHDSRMKKQCIATRYVILLLLQLLQEPDSLRFMVGHCGRLIAVADFFKDNSSSLLSSVHTWTLPLRTLLPHLDTPHMAVGPLMELITGESSKQGCLRSSKGVQPVLTALRLVWFSVCSPVRPKEAFRNLKQMQAVLELTSCGGLEQLTTLLQKVADALMPFWKQRQIPNVSIQRYLVAVVTLALNIIESMLVEFKEKQTFCYLDCTLLKALFSVHMVFCVSPITRVMSQAADELQEKVVTILSLFSIGNKTGLSTGEVEQSKDPWHLLLEELLVHHLPSSPQGSLNALELLTELLPLPLPMEVPQGFMFSSTSEVLAYRQHWESQLQPFMNGLLSSLRPLLISCSLEIRQLLRRVLVQLADISATLAMQIARCILESVDRCVQRVSALEEKGGEFDKVADEKRKAAVNLKIKSEQRKLLLLCATLSVVAQRPAVKVAVTELVCCRKAGNGKAYPHLLQSLFQILETHESVAEPLKQCILVVFTGMCNFGVTFPTSKTAVSSQDVANSLPPQTQLKSIVAAVWSTLVNTEQAFSVVVECQKFLLSVAQCDQGIHALCILLPTVKGTLTSFMKRLIKTLKSPSDVPKEVYECCSLFFQLMDSFLFDIEVKTAQLKDAGMQSVQRSNVEQMWGTEAEEGEARGMVEGSEEGTEEIEGDQTDADYLAQVDLEGLREIRSLSIPADWVSSEIMEDDNNLLQLLSDTIKEHCEGKKDLESFVKSVEEFADSLYTIIADRAGEGVPDPPRLNFPERASIQEQFEDRVPVVETATVSAGLDLWLPGPPYQEESGELLTVSVNLQAMASEHCPTMNIEEEMKKQILPSPPHSPAHKFRKPKSNLLAERQRLRKEALLRQGPFTGRGKDIFRSRKSTTSRAPSMHVDDFMKFGQPTRPSPHMGSYGLNPYMAGMSGGPFMSSHLATARPWSGIMPGGHFGPHDFHSLLRMNPHLAASMRTGMRPGMR